MRSLRSVAPAAALTVAATLTLGLAAPRDSGLAERSSVERIVDDHAGSFSPDGKTIVFTRYVSTLRHGIDTHPVPQRATPFLMRANGSRKRALRHRGARFDDEATFSPDGRSILFVRDGRVFVMRRDGSRARPVRRDFLEQACPRFSPDGTMISLWRGKATKSGAYFVMNSDGTGLRRITGSGGERFPWGCPSWLPDGKRLVFAKDYSLYLASVAGTISRLTDDEDGTLYRPSVSRNGRWIACDGFIPEGRHAGNGVIVMRVNGTAITRITSYTNESKPDGSATWSPDGRRILFSGYRGRFDGSGVYIVARDGTSLRRLSNFAG